jgi:hypothetical protein
MTVILFLHQLKLILMVVIGVWVGLMIPHQPIFAIIYGLLGLWEFTKKG